MPAKPEELLVQVADTLTQYGRPRKNPGGERPYIVLQDGSSREKLFPRHIQQISRLSLPGAFRYVEINGSYTKKVSEKAKIAFYEAETGNNGSEIVFGGSNNQLDQELARIDQETMDSRQIIRNLRAAAKKLRKNSN